MPFQIVKNNIVNMSVDAIVNAANSRLQMGSGVCGAIFDAAGPFELQHACDQIGYCATGDAVITPGFNLPARYIIHTVGPIWMGGKSNEESLLRSAYIRSLELAQQNNLRSIAFPLISSGVYGYPKAEALHVAMSAIQAFLLNADDMDVYLVVFDLTAFQLPEKLTGGVESYISEHFVQLSEAAQPSHRFQLESEFFGDLCDAAPPRCVAPTAKPACSLERLLAHRHEETFSEMLLRLVDEKDFPKDSIVYKRANLDRSVFFKLRSNKDYAPSKSTALALCIALELNIDQAKELLACAGFALSLSNLGDVIVSYFIESAQYDIFEVNAALFRYGQPCLGANIDAIDAASRIGIRPERAVNYHADSADTRLNYDVVSDAICEVRECCSMSDGWKARIDDDFNHRNH